MGRCRGLTAAAVALLVVAGCGGRAQEPTGSLTPSLTSAAPDPSGGATDPRSLPAMTTPSPVTALYQPGDIDAALQPYIDTATTDLAARLGVSTSDLTTRAAVLVIWPDPSLGCPATGMRYAQVPTDGSIIELEHAGHVYRFHTGGARGPFLCRTPLATAPARLGAPPSSIG